VDVDDDSQVMSIDTDIMDPGSVDSVETQRKAQHEAIKIFDSDDLFLDGSKSTATLNRNLKKTNIYDRGKSLPSGVNADLLIEKLEKSMDKTFKSISVMNLPVIENDVMKIDDSTPMNGHLISPVIPGTLVIINNMREGCSLYSITKSGIKEMSIKPQHLNVFDGMAENIQFLSTIIGFLIEGASSSSLVLVDIINYNGHDISSEPYISRFHRLHDMLALLYHDCFSMIPIKHGISINGFIREAKENHFPMFMINTDHVHGSGSPLIHVARFKGGNVIPGDATIIDTVVAETHVVEPVVQPVIELSPPAPVPLQEALPLSGLHVFSAGKVNGMNKESMQKIIEANGGTWHPRVNCKLDMLVVGESPGEKILLDATSYHVAILTPKDFFAMIAKNTSINLDASSP
jgi:hypothetical protein